MLYNLNICFPLPQIKQVIMTSQKCVEMTQWGDKALAYDQATLDTLMTLNKRSPNAVLIMIR